MSGEVRDEDLRIDIFDCLADCADRYHFRVTHVPSGVFGEATGPYYIRTRERAMAALRERVATPPAENTTKEA